MYYYYMFTYLPFPLHSELLEGRDCVMFSLHIFFFLSELFKSPRHSDFMFAIVYPDSIFTMTSKTLQDHT